MTICDILKIEERRKKGLIGLRVPDTNAFMIDPDVIYRLSGNLSEIVTLSEIDFMLDTAIIDKEPHDILFPMHVLRELNHVKDTNKSSAARRKARIAEQGLDLLLRRYLRKEFKEGALKQPLIDGTPVVLRNGANLYFADISDDYLEEKSTILARKDGDTVISLTTDKFLKKNGHYKKITFVSRDSGARSTSIIQTGILGVPFRYAEPVDPLQLNKGWGVRDVNYKEYQKIIAASDLSLDGPIVKIDLDSLVSNQAIEFRKKRQKPIDGREYDSHFMIYNQSTESIREPRYYNDFLDFFRNFRVKKGNEEITLDMLNQIMQVARRVVGQNKKKRLNKRFINIQNDHKYKDVSSRIKNLYNELMSNSQVSQNFSYSRQVLDKDFRHCNITPKGLQIPFIDHMVNPEIIFTSIDANFGFGKTILPLAVGLYHLEKGNFKKIVYYGSMTSADEGVGTLPGDYDAKIERKVRAARQAIHRLFGDPMGTNKYVAGSIDKLIQRGMLELDVISDIKGITHNETFLIIDEVQFYREGQLTLAMSRLGDNSRGVICCSIDQINATANPYNVFEAGIFDVVESLSGREDYAHITAPVMQVYRGPGAKLSALVKSKARRYML